MTIWCFVWLARPSALAGWPHKIDANLGDKLCICLKVVNILIILLFWLNIHKFTRFSHNMSSKFSASQWQPCRPLYYEEVRRSGHIQPFLWHHNRWDQVSSTTMDIGECCLCWFQCSVENVKPLLFERWRRSNLALGSFRFLVYKPPP